MGVLDQHEPRQPDTLKQSGSKYERILDALVLVLFLVLAVAVLALVVVCAPIALALSVLAGLFTRNRGGNDWRPASA